MATQCPACHFENPDGFAFCGKCGAKLVIVCSQCGAEIPPGFAFCGRCGARLTPAAPVGAITEGELTRIEPYLPPGFLDTLPPAALWQPVDVTKVQEMLAHLLDNVVTYLPRYLVQAELAAPDAAAGGEFLRGTLLFSDISGFTAMSERLSTLGKEGAEQIVALVNRYFSAMLDVLFAYGGDLFKFGGDALLAYFPDDPTTPGSVNALHAAWAMQQAMADFRQVETSLGTFPLQMKIGMHAGAFFAARVGTPTKREFVVTGATVNATAMAESAAVAGQILVSDAVYAQVQAQPGFTFTPGPPGYHLPDVLPPSTSLSSAPISSPWPPSAASPAEALQHTTTALERLTPYLPPGLLARLLSETGGRDARPTAYDSGEHRLVAILFANFTGASELVDHLGPGHEGEIARALNDYFTAMDEVVERYGGVVNKIDLYDHGDKLMALFGAPVAHEDDAERAVRTALDMQRALEEAIPWAHQRIGVSTGMVFAGHVGGATRREYTVMGDEVNLAARLMSAAQDGEVLLASYVQRKVRPFFEVADRGEVQLKGKSKPVPTFTIVGRRAQPEPVRGIRGLRSTLVGRGEEQATLRRLVAELFTGRGGILSLIGEAGLGKSRMVAEMHASVMDEIALTWVEGRCLSYTQHVSYSAFTDVIHAFLGILDTDNEFDIREKLRRYIAYLFPSGGADDVQPYLAHFLNLPLSEPEAERVTYLSGEALQRQMLRAIATLIERIAMEQPLVIVFDDLHWADSSSLLLLERCLTLTDRVPLLIVMLYRPVRDHGCYDLGLQAARDYPHRYVELVLKPLDLQAGQDQELVCNLLALEELPPALARLISRAEGNPFYIEEIIRSLIDRGIVVPQDGGWRLAREIDLRTVPDSLQGLIMARIDQLLEEARRTLQLAAVVGRSFTHELLAWLSSAAALMVQAAVTHLDGNLAALQRTELIRERARLPELEYIFKHVMVRDVAYESLLLRDRRTYHGLIGRHLEEIYTGQKREEVYELLAHHYSLSDEREKALDYLIKSGDKARAAYANLEAIAFYRQAETLANELAEVTAQAFIAAGLGDVLFHVGESTEALACYERALVCCADEKRQADLYQRIAIVYEKRGDYEQALAKCTQGMALLPADAQASVEMARLRIARSRIYEQQGQSDAALSEGEKSLVLLEGTTHYLEIAQAHNVLGLGFRSNHPQKAIQHLEQALVILERIGDEYEAARIYNNLAILYYQTDLARSTAYFTQVLTTMQRLGNVWQEAVAYLNLGAVHFVQGHHAQAIDYYQRSLAMQERLGNTLGIANCHINLGEAYRAEGDLDQAIENLEQGLSIAQEIGASDAEAECLRQLAECYVEIGAPERALTACEKALSYAETMGNRHEEAAIHRVLGKAHTGMHNLPEAWRSLEQSIAILRELEQEFDLGTALVDYAYVLRDAGKRDLARAALTEALALFERLQLPQELERVRATLDQITQK